MRSFLVMRLQSFASLEINLPKIGPVRVPPTAGGSMVGFLAAYDSYEEALKHAKDPALVREIQLASLPPISNTRKN